MRNWNDAWAVQRKNAGQMVFTVPMRNWNYNASSNNKQAIHRFYSTYEELKPPWSTICCVRVLCFYSTYEELKLS